MFTPFFRVAGIESVPFAYILAQKSVHPFSCVRHPGETYAAVPLLSDEGARWAFSNGRINSNVEPSPGLLFDRDLASVRLDHLFNNRQAESQSVPIFSVRFQVVGHFSDTLFGNAGAGISNPAPHNVICI